MLATDLMTLPCTVEHYEPGNGDDDMGDPDSGAMTPHATRCELQQTSAVELRETGALEVTSWNIFLPPDVPVSAQDVVDIPGRGRFTFDGDPWIVRHPITRALSHQQGRVRQVT